MIFLIFRKGNFGSSELTLKFEKPLLLKWQKKWNLLEIEFYKRSETSIRRIKLSRSVFKRDKQLILLNDTLAVFN